MKLEMPLNESRFMNKPFEAIRLKASLLQKQHERIRSWSSSEN